MSTTNSSNIVALSGTPLIVYNEFVSFTPTIAGTTIAGVGTYTTQFGRYTRIGNLIHVDVQVVWTAHTGTGSMLLTALPFTVRNTASYTPYAAVNLQNAVTGGAVLYVVAQFTLNTTQAALMGIRSNNTNLATAMDAAATLRFSGCYIT